MDNYCHLSPNVVYSPTNIPGPGLKTEEFESQIIGGCTCDGGYCFLETCGCISRFGENYNDDQKILGTKCNGPIMECNSTCACIGRNCGNRVVQRGPLVNLEIFECSSGKGRGLRSKCNIESGTFVCEYAGEVIGAEESCRRINSQNINDMNYIFHLKEHLSDGSTINTYIDPSFIGNIGRYINHSCEPNCIVVPVRVDSLVPRLGIFASKDIPAWEEITFNYGSDDRKCLNNTNLKICLCGKLKCKKYLPYDP